MKTNDQSMRVLDRPLEYNEYSSSYFITANYRSEVQLTKWPRRWVALIFWRAILHRFDLFLLVVFGVVVVIDVKSSPTRGIVRLSQRPASPISLPRSRSSTPSSSSSTQDTEGYRIIRGSRPRRDASVGLIYLIYSSPTC